MAFAYRPKDSNVTKATRRLARRRADHALKALRGGEPPDEALHTARKDAKKLRALVKLIGPAFPGYRAENAALRDAARAVSGLRDRTAMIEAFDRVTEGADAAAFATVRAALEARAPATADEKQMVAAFAAAFVALRTRAKRWRLRKKGFAALEAGLCDRFAGARAAMRAARERGTEAAFHDWRKRAKTHWYHAALLAEVSPKRMAPHVALAGEVAERLGDHHDLMTLAALLPGLDLPETDRAAFAARLDDQRRALEARTFALGDKLYAASPKALARRWRKWWDRSRR